MSRTRKFFRRNQAPAVETKSTTLTPEVTLKCGEKDVGGIACVADHDSLAVSTWERGYIYEYDTQGEPILEISGVRDVVHLSDDVLASVDGDDMLLTWRATTGDVLDHLKVSRRACRLIMKASATEILV